MPAFHEVRLDMGIDYGAEGGPLGSVIINEQGSGHEQRNIQWAEDLAEWQLGERLINKTTHDTLLAFFRARRSMAYGFRFKDWADFKITSQAIGSGNASATAFQVYKRYSSGGYNYDRTITKLVSGTVSVLLNATPQTETTHYTVNYNTGVITFLSAPGNGVVVTVTCEFDVPVRFATPKFSSRFDAYDSPSGDAHFYLSSLPIREVRV